MLTVKELQDFEQEMAGEYSTGLIRAPVHLRGSENGVYESEILHWLQFKKEGDYFFGYWDSHCPALAWGIPKGEVKDEIRKGNSIALNFPRYNFFCSGIVASLMGVAVGVAWSLKQQNIDKTVYHYCGDMSSHTGMFYEAAKYSHNWDLPVKFMVGNNELSVMTDTRSVWNTEGMEHIFNMKFWRVEMFSYKNRWPHSGLKERIKF